MTLSNIFLTYPDQNRGGDFTFGSVIDHNYLRNPAITGAGDVLKCAPVNLFSEEMGLI